MTYSATVYVVMVRVSDSVSVKLHLNGQTDTSWKRIECILALKCDIWWQLFFMIFLISTDKISFLLVDSLKFSRSVPPPPLHRMDALDRHSGQSDKRTRVQMEFHTNHTFVLSSSLYLM